MAAAQNVVLSGFGSTGSVNLIVLSGFGGSAAPGVDVATDTVDLLPWDFLIQFGRQQQEWLRARKKWDIEHAVQEAYEALPEPERAELEVPLQRAVVKDNGVSTIVMRVNYPALLAQANLLSALLERVLANEQAQRVAQALSDEDDEAVAILMADV